MKSTYLTIEFLDNIDHKVLQYKCNKVASISSSYPDSKLVINIRSAYEAKAAIFVATVLTESQLQIYRYKFFEHLATIAYKNNYEGGWREVQEILELKALTPHSLIQHYDATMSRQDIFGNLIPTINRILQHTEMCKPRQNRSRVRKPQFKRGYDDKGSMRFPHEYHSFWEHDGLNPEREDRRFLVSPPSRPIFWRGPDS